MYREYSWYDGFDVKLDRDGVRKSKKGWLVFLSTRGIRVGIPVHLRYGYAFMHVLQVGIACFLPIIYAIPRWLWVTWLTRHPRRLSRALPSCLQLPPLILIQATLSLSPTLTSPIKHSPYHGSPDNIFLNTYYVFHPFYYFGQLSLWYSNLSLYICINDFY